MNEVVDNCTDSLKMYNAEMFLEYSTLISVLFISDICFQTHHLKTVENGF